MKIFLLFTIIYPKVNMNVVKTILPRQLLSAKRISKATSLIKNAKVSEVQLDESLFKENEGSIQGCQVQRKKMCDNELFPKDSLSFVSPGGPPLLCLS